MAGDNPYLETVQRLFPKAQPDAQPEPDEQPPEDDGDELANPNASDRAPDKGLRKRDVHPDYNNLKPVLEPTQEELEQQGLDQPYTNPKTGRVSQGVEVPEQDQEQGQPAAQNPYLATVQKLFPKDGQQPAAAADGGADNDTIGQFLNWRARKPQFDSVQALDVLRYAEASGKPVDWVADHLDDVRKSVDASQVDMRDLASKAPALQDYLARQGVRVDAHKDDIPILTGLERTLHMPLVAESLRDGALEQVDVAKQFGDFLGLADDQSATANQPENDYEAKSFLGNAAVRGARMGPMMLLDLLSRAIGGGVGAAVGAATGAGGGAAAGVPEGGVGAIPGAFVGGLGGAGVGAATGQEVGSALFNSVESIAPMYEQLKNQVDQDGNKLDPTVARIGAGLGGVLVGGVTGLLGGPAGKYIGKYLEPVVGLVPGGKEVLERYGQEAVIDAIARSGMATNLDRIIARYGVHYLQGATLMAVQSGLTSFSEEITKGLAPGQPFDAHLSNAVYALRDGLYKGLQDMPFVAGVGTASEALGARKANTSRVVLEDRGRDISSQQGAARLQQLVDAVQQSKTLAKMAPGERAELISSMLLHRDAPAEIRIDRQAWDELHQPEKKDPAEAAKEFTGDDGEAYAHAKITGDLVVPTEKFVDLAATDPERVAKLLPDARIEVDDRSPRQMQEQREQVQKRAAELAKLEPGELEDSAREVYEDIRAKAEAAKTDPKVADANARMVASAMQSWAEKFQRDGSNVTARDLYDQQGDVTIEGPRGAQLEQEPENLKALRKRYAGMTDEQRKSSLYVDRLTGLYNERGYEARAHDESRPYTTEVQVAQAKTINDKLGHDAGDNVLKLFGNVLKANGVNDGVRRENTVSFDSPTYEDAQKIVQRMKDTLGHDQVVTSGTARAQEGDTGADRLRRAAKEHARRKTEGRTPDEQGRTKIPLRDTPFAETTDAAALKAHLGAQERPASATVTPSHEQDFERLSGGDIFREANLTPEGQLNENGYRLAVDHATDQAKEYSKKLHGKGWDDVVPKLKDGKPVIKDGKPVMQERWRQYLHFLSADVRGVGDINREFGAGLSWEEKGKPTDEIMSAIAEQLARRPEGREFFVARPHGDEFYAVHVGDAVELDKLRAYFTQADEASSKSAFYREVVPAGAHEPTHVILQRGLRIAHGTGGTFDEADREALPEAKRQQDQHPDLEQRPVKPELVDADKWQRVARDLTKRTGHEPQAVGRGLREEAPGERGPASGNSAPGGGGDQGGGEGSAGPRGTGEVGGGVEGQEAGPAAGAERPELGHAQPGVGARTPWDASFELESSKRGRIKISFPEDGKRRSFNIKLLATADASTLAHEMGHYLSEVMGDIAQRPDAPQEIKDDYAGLLKFMGYDDHAQRNAERIERNKLKNATGAEDKSRLAHLTAKEERFAHALEQYLAEGKAPSVALARPFALFRNWMIRIYRNISALQDNFRRTYGEEIGLSDHVREIFDRMLASSDEVEKQQRAQAAQPFPDLFKDATPEDRAEYEKTNSAALENAKTEMVRRIAAAQKDENTEYFKDEKQRFRDEANEKLDADPTYRAIRFLQQGDRPERPGEVPPELKGEGTDKPVKLDRGDVRKLLGDEVVSEMGRKHPGIFAKKGEPTMKADELAPLLGFDNGDAMARAIQVAEPRKQLVEAKAQQDLEDLYTPSVVHDAQRMATEAIASLHNPEAIHAALLEHRRLAKMLAPDQARRIPDLDRETLKATAKRLVSQLPVGRIIAGAEGAAGEYRRAERTSANRMREAFLAGKVDEALAENQNRLLNMHLWREARDARERLESQQNKLRQATREPWQMTLGKADVAATEANDKASDHAYRGATNALLQAVGVMETPPGGIDRAPFEALVRAVGEEHIPEVDQLRELLADPRDWKDLTQDEAQAVHDAVKVIHFAAGKQVEFDIEGKAIDKAALFDRLRELAAKGKQVPPRAASEADKTLLGDKVPGFFRGFDAYLTSVDRWVDELDNYDRNGPAHQVLMDKRLAARDVETRLDRDVAAKVIEHIEAMPKALRARMTEKVPGLDQLLPVRKEWEGVVRPPSVRQDLWVLLLNSGNEGNRQRLRDGNGWSDANMDRALNLLEPEEAKFLQGMLDVIETLHPDLAKVYERRYGLPLGEVAARSVTVRGEKYRGGYFPIRYDSDLAKQGAMQMADIEKDIFNRGMASPSVFSGHTKSREEKVNAPISMEFGTVATHIAQVVHDISMGDWVREAASFVKDDRFKAIALKRLGKDATELMVPWLRDIANERAGSSAAAAEKTPGAVRVSLAIAGNRAIKTVMALNMPSMIAHLTDPLMTLGVEAHSPGELALRAGRVFPLFGPSYLKTMAGWIDGREEYARSKELGARESRETANVRRELAKLPLPKNPVLRQAATLRDFVDHAATMTRFYLDRFHARIIWQTGYDEGIARDMEPDEAARHGDDMLAKTLPGGDVAEKSALQRSKSGFAQTAAVLYGYANKMYNLWLHAPLARAADNGWSKPSSAADLAAKWVAMTAIGTLGGYLAGRGHKDEDDQRALLFGNLGLTGYVMRRALFEPMNTIPMLGSAVEQLVEGKQVSVRTSPQGAVIEESGRRLQKALKSWEDGTTSDEDLLSLLESMTTTSLGVGGQGQRTFGYLDQLRHGQLPPQGPLDVAGGLVFGPQSRR